MAEPIPLNLPPHDPREALFRRLENAPQEHAEALLNVYEILQGLHDRGILELAKGALGSSEKILEIAVDAVNTPEVIQGIRNFMILTKLFAAIDPRLLENLAGALPKALTEAKTEKPLGLVKLFLKLSDQNTRRTLTIAAGLAESLGKGLGPEEPGS